MNKKTMLIVVTITFVIIIASVLLLLQHDNDSKDIVYDIDQDDLKSASADTSSRYISPFTKKTDMSRRNAELFLSKAIAEDDLDNDGISTVKNCLSVLKKNADDNLPNFVLKYIQNNFDYISDNELYNEREWAAFSIETLDKKAGDCEDLAILLISLMYCGGYECGITVFDSISVDGKKLPSHAVAMVAVDSIQENTNDNCSQFYCEYGEKKYYAFETTTECTPGYTFKEYVDSVNCLQSNYTFMTIEEYLSETVNQ